MNCRQTFTAWQPCQGQSWKADLLLRGKILDAQTPALRSAAYRGLRGEDVCVESGGRHSSLILCRPPGSIWLRMLGPRGSASLHPGLNQCRPPDWICRPAYRQTRPFILGCEIILMVV